MCIHPDELETAKRSRTLTDLKEQRCRAKSTIDFARFESFILRRLGHMAMAKKYFAGRHQENFRTWNVIFQMGGEVILTQAVSLGPLDTFDLKRQLKLPVKAEVLVELAR